MTIAAHGKVEELVRDDPRNPFEHRENDLIRHLFTSIGKKREARLAAGELIIHYRTELVRQHFLTREAANAESTPGRVSRMLEVRDVVK